MAIRHLTFTLPPLSTWRHMAMAFATISHIPHAATLCIAQRYEGCTAQTRYFDPNTRDLDHGGAVSYTAALWRCESVGIFTMAMYIGYNARPCQCAQS